MDNTESDQEKRGLSGIYGSKFSTLFMVVALMMMLIPFISTFNHFLTQLFLKWELYQILEDVVVPYQTRLLAGIFSLFNVSVYAADKGIWLGGNFLEIEWNCLGWQSGVLLIASFLTGFKGNFSKMSRLETILIGVLGTYIVNLVRMLVVGGLATGIGYNAAVIFHDWVSLILVIMWFFAFWWFSYSFVLEERMNEKELRVNISNQGIS